MDSYWSDIYYFGKFKTWHFAVSYLQLCLRMRLWCCFYAIYWCSSVSQSLNCIANTCKFPQSQVIKKKLATKCKLSLLPSKIFPVPAYSLACNQIQLKQHKSVTWLIADRMQLYSTRTPSPENVVLYKAKNHCYFVSQNYTKKMDQYFCEATYVTMCFSKWLSA